MSPSNGKNSNLVCVFCASHDSPDSSYNDAADILGKELASAGYGLVYGGGSRGLMGRVARAVDNNSGDVLGVMPRALTRLEGTTQVGRHILVDSMHERKSIMNDNAMAFIALPGGYGTFEELLEIVTWCHEDTEDPTELIAKAIHEVWRKNCGLETCIKTVTEDKDWVLKNGSKCDIQATAYEDLPSDWKCKSISLAKIVIEIVSKTHNTVSASEQLYDVWYSSGCSKVKKIAFEELSHEQQESFISIIRLAMSFML
ncbi:hypothetical protein GGI15_003332 [Coemansia interrupta]|uniref:Cytokinin riboside 5'-monophosphate phosphoribohydrolase n=1 Tax=Coemansia interrupta TaxID=1126814 RepID=A0A9W8LJ42_9FUNG|nr:hypothetical protein GGI15_003332 [Coemansia interrupta]